MTISTTVHSLIAKHRTWLANHGQGVHDQEMQLLESDLAKGSLNAFVHVPTDLSGLAAYHGKRGTVRVLAGDAEGWGDVRTSVDFSGWALRIAAELHFGRHDLAVLNLTNRVSAAASLACVSDTWGNEMVHILRKVDSDPTAVHQPFWASRRFEPFVVHLHDIAEGASPDCRTLPDPYQGVVDAWDDLDRLAAALETVCDYHVNNMEDDGGDWRPEFTRPPFDLLACEVMLVRRIRNELGLETPTVDHPLVSVLGLDLAIDGQPEHPVLAALEDAFYKCFY